MPRVDGETSPDTEVNCTVRPRRSASSSPSRSLRLFPSCGGSGSTVKASVVYVTLVVLKFLVSQVKMWCVFSLIIFCISRQSIVKACLNIVLLEIFVFNSKRKCKNVQPDPSSFSFVFLSLGGNTTVSVVLKSGHIPMTQNY